MPPDLYFALTLVVKMAVTAGFVVAATVTAERAGPVVGGLVATLPIGAGPVYVFLAMDHDAHFIAHSAVGEPGDQRGERNLGGGVFAVRAEAFASGEPGGVAMPVWLLLVLFVLHAIEMEFRLLGRGDEIGGARRSRCGLTRSLCHVRMPAFHARWNDFLLRAVMVAVLVGVVVTFQLPTRRRRQRLSSRCSRWC